MHILLATDGSANGNAGGDLLTSIEPPPDITVTVLVVVPGSFIPGAHLEAAASSHATEPDEIAASIARENADRLRRAGYDATEQIRHGAPAQEIVDAARELRPDLIVLGARGVGRLHRLLFGSVATAVARQATVPVLLTVEPVSLSTVMVVSDNSARAMRSVEALRRIPSEMLLRVVMLMVNRFGSVGDAIAGEFEKMAGDLRQLGIDVAVLERAGNEVDAILETAASEAVTLIIVATSGEMADGEPVLGSTAHGLLERAPCSLLIAR